MFFYFFSRQYSLDQYTITLGDHAAKMDDGTEQNFKIARVIKHDYDSETKDNDIALIQVSSKFIFSEIQYYTFKLQSTSHTLIHIL